MAKHNHYCGGDAAKHISSKAQPYHVMIASPSSRGFPTAYVMSLAATVETLVRFGIKFDFHVLDGDCHVDDARNKVVREFLITPCTDLFFIDSDMGWTAEGLLKLLKAEGDVVGGIYRHKNDEETYPFHPGENCERTAADDGLFEMPKIPTGFMRIRRHVLEKLHQAEVDAGRYFWDSPEDEATGKPPLGCVFERAFASELKLNVPVGDKSDRHSGDLVFCLKARHHGFTVRADIEQTFAHVGEKEWVGNLAQKMRQDQNVDAPGFIKAVEALKSGDVSPWVFKAINDHSYIPRSALPGPALMACYNAAREAQGAVLELGSGISTLVMGLALAGTDNMVHAFESDLAWFKTTGAMLERWGVKNVMLHYAPLVPYDGFDWYGWDDTQFQMPVFDVVVLDGPERKKSLRESAFKVIPDLMHSARTWIIDDMADPNQQSMLNTHGVGRHVEMHRAVSVNTEHQYAIAVSQAA